MNFTKPKELNGDQLVDELIEAGVSIQKTKFAVMDNGQNEIVLDIPANEVQKAETVILAHKAKPIPQPTITDKLASVGLSIDDLKTALGL